MRAHDCRITVLGGDALLSWATARWGRPPWRPPLAAVGKLVPVGLHGDFASLSLEFVPAEALAGGGVVGEARALLDALEAAGLDLGSIDALEVHVSPR